jgi:hypothetical protein
MINRDARIAKKTAKRLAMDTTKKITTKEKAKRGEHYKGKTKKTDTIAFDKIILSNRIKMPRNGWKNTCFVSAFFITIMLVVLAFGLLFVDSRTHSFGWGTQNTAFAFSSQSKGIANITIMGKSFAFDFSILNPVNNAMTRIYKMYLYIEPAFFRAVRIFLAVIWQGIAQLGSLIVSLF